MARTTKAEVTGMGHRALHAAAHAGVDITGWAVVEGSVTYGRAWRLYRIDERGGQNDVIGSDGYLGSTIREAYLSLHALARAFELVSS